MRIKTTSIDSGWFAISDSAAGKLAKTSALGRLPRIGYETTVTYDGADYWLSRTAVKYALPHIKRGWVWSIRRVRSN